MNIWIVMAGVLWLLVLIGKFFDKGSIQFLFACFDGLLLAFLCFLFMPIAFGENRFWIGVIGSLVGVCSGAFLEQKMMGRISGVLSHTIHSLVFSATIFLFLEEIPLFGESMILLSLVFSFLGGLFLFVVCSGILPETEIPRKKLLRGSGGLVGFVVGVLLLCGNIT